MTVRSFRAEIARRSALSVGALLATVAVASGYALKELLENDLDATLLRIAETEAETGAERAPGEFQFHEGVLLTREDPALPELTRYAQVLARDGTVLFRSRNLSNDLPSPPEAVAEAIAGGLAWVTHRDATGERLRSLFYPLPLARAGRSERVLQVIAPYQPLLDTVAAFAGFVGILTIGATAVAFIMGWRGAGMALRPTRDIAAQAQALEAGSLSARITAHADVAEFHQMVKVLNDMLDRLERAFQSQRRFTADASHELRGPLNVLRGEIEVALSRPRGEAEYRLVLERCRDEVLRLARLADDLLTLARADAGALAPRRAPIDLFDVAESVVSRYRPVAAERQARLQLEGRTVWIQGDGQLLERAVANLVDNALKHTGVGGLVTVRVTPADPATITVRDTGPGIPPDHVPHLFERFFLPDPARPRAHGAGLGLAIARAAAEAHKGTLTFEGNAPGAVFRLALPVDAGTGAAVVGVAAGD